MRFLSLVIRYAGTKMLGIDTRTRLELSGCVYKLSTWQFGMHLGVSLRKWHVQAHVYRQSLCDIVGSWLIVSQVCELRCMLLLSISGGPRYAQ